MKMCSAAAMALLGVFLSPSPSHANGRFPASLDVRFHPTNTDTIYVSLTFGLAISQDDGQSWTWVCEDALTYNGNFDPDYAIADDGSIFIVTNGRAPSLDADAGGLSAQPALRISRDNGCTWREAPAPLDNKVVGDVEIDTNGNVWVATAGGNEENDVLFSDDNGASFTSKGLTDGLAFWRSLRVSPTNSNRVFVTGKQPSSKTEEAAALLYRTDNGGQNWTKLPVDTFPFGPGKDLLLLGIAPTQPNESIFVRVIEPNAQVFHDAIYRSTDSGASWEEVLETQAFIQAFTITSRGDIIVGTAAENGVFISSNNGDSFQPPTQSPLMGCVGERSDGTLFACGSNWEPDFFALGRSTDNGQTWEKTFRFNEICAAVSCNTGTVQRDVCEAVQFPVLREDFGIKQADAGVDMVDAGKGNGNGDGCGGCQSAILVLLLVYPVRRRRRPGDFDIPCEPPRL